MHAAEKAADASEKNYANAVLKQKTVRQQYYQQLRNLMAVSLCLRLGFELDVFE